jgi:hypothetical protein
LRTIDQKGNQTVAKTSSMMFVRALRDDCTEADELGADSWTKFPVGDASTLVCEIDAFTLAVEVRFSAETCIREIYKFEGCLSLRKIEIPDSVVKIGKRAFTNCRKLIEVVFAPDGALEGLSGFQSCCSLCTIDIPASVKAINKTAFQFCSSLREVHFAPNSQLSEVSGFQNCHSLLRIEIPASVKIIYATAFYQCRSLFEVKFAPHSSLIILNGFIHCDSLPRVTIPRSVQTIVALAFRKCMSLWEVVFETNALSRWFDCPRFCRIEIPSEFSPGDQVSWLVRYFAAFSRMVALATMSKTPLFD